MDQESSSDVLAAVRSGRGSRAAVVVIALFLSASCGIKASPRPPELPAPVASPVDATLPVESEPAIDPVQPLSSPMMEDELDAFDEETIF